MGQGKLMCCWRRCAHGDKVDIYKTLVSAGSRKLSVCENLTVEEETDEARSLYQGVITGSAAHFDNEHVATWNS